MESFENESYWNKSARKAFSFDDDIDDVDNETVATGLGQAASAVLNEDAISEASFDNSNSTGNLNFSINALLSDEAINEIILEQTLDDRIIKKGVSPEEELKLLRRQIQTTLYNPSAHNTAQKLLLGKNVPLEGFKSLHEKEQLLEAVLENGGGDAIITVLLFLKKTLNPKHFQKVLQNRPTVFKQYISFLKQTNINEAVELLEIFNKQNEAALINFQEACNSNNVAVRKHKLNHLVQHYKSEANTIRTYQEIFRSSLNIVEIVEQQSNALDNRIHINSSPIEILYECCCKYSNWTEQDMLLAISPFKISAEHKISPSQFEWTALNERTRAQAYTDLQALFEKVSTWNPIKQKQFHMSFSLDAALSRLYHLKAPDAVLYHFLSKMSNNQEKLDLAKKVNCIKGIVDALTGLKDITQLTQLKENLPERTEEYFYCEKALKNLQNKRWSTDNIKLSIK